MRGVPEKLRTLVEETVEAMAFEAVGVEFHTAGRHSLLRIYIDKPEGVTIDDCADVSRQVSAVLDVEDPISGQYTLEVSSPGLDRPLFRESDFERFTGRDVKIRTMAPIDGRKRFKGRLLGIEEGGRVIIEMEGERIELDFDSIHDARLVPDI